MKRSRAIGNALSYLLLALTVAIVLYGIIALPPTIAAHFGADGVGYGSKYTLLLMLVPLLIIVALFAGVERLPLRTMNLPMVRITPENESRVREGVLAMLAWIKASTVALFAVMALAAVQSASGSLSPLFVVLVLWEIPMLAVLGYFIVALARIGG